RQLPFGDRRAVDHSAVGGVEIHQQGDGAVPLHVRVLAGHARVGDPEQRGLAAADHVRALPQVEGAAAAVVQNQTDTLGARLRPGPVRAGLRVVLLPVALGVVLRLVGLRRMILWRIALGGVALGGVALGGVAARRIARLREGLIAVALTAVAL